MRSDEVLASASFSHEAVCNLVDVVIYTYIETLAFHIQCKAFTHYAQSDQADI